ncbi:uncharacterized protein [Haliotis asinina]|uniref:uncharacterized protein n=1 Tax=Haliotis asinina TaxID=109174 RepID=UPI0035324795
MERVQSQAARFVCNNYTDHDQGCVATLLHHPGWETLQLRRADKSIRFTHVQVEVYNLLDLVSHNLPFKIVIMWNDILPAIRKKELPLGCIDVPAIPLAETPDVPAEPEQTDVVMEHGYALRCAGQCVDKLTSLTAEVQDLKASIKSLQQEIHSLSLRRSTFSINDICDSEEKMLFYTTLHYNVFKNICSMLERLDLNYCAGWKPSTISMENQLLLTLMKLTMDCKDLDLAQRFDISRATVSNISNTLIHALHELL